MQQYSAETTPDSLSVASETTPYLVLKPNQINPAMLELIKLLGSLESVDKFRLGLARLLRHRPVQVALGARHFAQQLREKSARRLPSLPVDRDIVAEVVKHVMDNDPSINTLQRIAKRDHEASSLAASVLLACLPNWRPTTPAPRFAGALLSDARWNGINLREANLRGSDLCHADLTDSVLEDVEGELSFFEGTLLEDARVNRSRFVAAAMKACRCRNASMEYVSFVNADLRHADLSQATLNRCRFNDADLSHASFFEAELTGGSLVGAVMDMTDLRKARLHNVRLQSVSLRTALLDDADFLGSRLESCDLESIQAQRIRLEGADLRGAYLTGSKLLDADFQHADLRNTGLGDIDWENADLRGADLSGCTFHMGSTRSGLVDSPYPSEGTRTGFYTDDYDDQYFKAPEEIRKANLCGADLRGAKIQGVDFYLVDLRGALYDINQSVHLQRTGAILRSRAT